MVRLGRRTALVVAFAIGMPAGATRNPAPHFNLPRHSYLIDEAIPFVLEGADPRAAVTIEARNAERENPLISSATFVAAADTVGHSAGVFRDGARVARGAAVGRRRPHWRPRDLAGRGAVTAARCPLSAPPSRRRLRAKQRRLARLLRSLQHGRMDGAGPGRGDGRNSRREDPRRR